MARTLTLRPATPADLAAVDLLLSRSYPRLLAADYPPSVMVTALPIISRARPELLASGRYFVAVDAEGRILGAGGWSGAAPGPSDQPEAEAMRASIGHIRHFATDPAALRRGIGRALMARVTAQARGVGMVQLDCLSTRTAVPFYASCGFRDLGPVNVALRPGIDFPAVRMICDLP